MIWQRKLSISSMLWLTHWVAQKIICRFLPLPYDNSPLPDGRWQIKSRLLVRIRRRSTNLCPRVKNLKKGWKICKLLMYSCALHTPLITWRSQNLQLKQNQFCARQSSTAVAFVLYQTLQSSAQIRRWLRQDREAIGENKKLIGQR